MSYYCEKPVFHTTDEFERTYEIVTEGVDPEVIKRTEELCEVIYNTLQEIEKE